MLIFFPEELVNYKMKMYLEDKEVVKNLALYLIVLDRQTYKIVDDYKVYKGLSRCFQENIYEGWFIELLRLMIDKDA